MSVGTAGGPRLAAMLGVDAGGTKIAAGPVDAQGRILADPVIEPSRTRDFASFLTGIAGTLKAAVERFDMPFGGVGLACAGTVDPIRGVVVTSPHLPLRDAPLRDVLEEALGMPVALENDANAAVLAEAKTGVATGLRHVVMLTLGTGVGGGLFLDGRLYRGVGGGAAELGHTIVMVDGELCPCGSRGCLEMYASGSALARAGARQAGSNEFDPEGFLAGLISRDELDGVSVSELAQGSYPGALAAVQEVGRSLGMGLVNLTNSFNPEMIVIGGGLSALGELLLGPAREVVQELALRPNKDQMRIVSAALGNSAGLVGGGLVAWERFGQDGGSAHAEPR